MLPRGFAAPVATQSSFQADVPFGYIVWRSHTLSENVLREGVATPDLLAANLGLYKHCRR